MDIANRALALLLFLNIAPSLTRAWVQRLPNRMQANDFVQSVIYTRGVKCSSCHDVHGTDNDALLLKPASVICLECHGSGSPNGPHTGTIERHTHHKPGSSGNECIACHMPKIEQTIADVNVRSHTFRFISPAVTEAYNIPSPCLICHKDKSTLWATERIKSWENVSGWRMAQ